MNEFLIEYQSYILFYMVGVVVNFIIGIFLVVVAIDKFGIYSVDKAIEENHKVNKYYTLIPFSSLVRGIKIYNKIKRINRFEEYFDESK